MTSSGGRQSRAGAWIRWLPFSEGLILFLAVAGPGYHYAIRRRGDHAFLARLLMEDPGYVEAAAVNFVVANLFVGCALLAAWFVTRLRRKT